MMPSPDSHRRRLLGSLGALALAAAWPQAWAASAMTLDGFTFQGEIRLGDATLQLNGTGYRAVAWFKGYAAGLYLTRPARTPAEVQAAPGPKRLRMGMLVDVDTEEFVKAFDKGVTRNTAPEELPRLTERMARFDAQVRAAHKVAKRDVIDLDFLPGQGLLLTINGVARGEPIPGEDLYSALLRSFVGDKPFDRSLRAGLLGGGSS
jgi:hypothetical protein